MKIKFSPKKKKNINKYKDLTQGKIYHVISIECDDYRIFNDYGKPYIYPKKMFKIIDTEKPKDWITEYGEDGEEYSGPQELSEPGFFEDYFDQQLYAIIRFHKYFDLKYCED